MNLVAKLRGADEGVAVGIDGLLTVTMLLDTIHGVLGLPRPLREYDMVLLSCSGEEIRLNELMAASLEDVGVLGIDETVLVSVKFTFVAQEKLRSEGIASADEADAMLEMYVSGESADLGLVRLIAAAGIVPLAPHLRRALKDERYDFAEALLEYTEDVDVRDEDGMTPLACFARIPAAASAQALALLLKYGAHVDAEDAYGRTPLSWAAICGARDCVRTLLEHGASVDAEDRTGRTPLLRAAEYGHPAVASILLEYNPRVDARDCDGQTPLCWFAQRGANTAVIMLLDHGAEVDAADSLERTPLSWAAQHGRVDVVNTLVARGACIDAEDVYGLTPLSWASRYARDGVEKLLLESGARGDVQ